MSLLPVASDPAQPAAIPAPFVPALAPALPGPIAPPPELPLQAAHEPPAIATSTSGMGVHRSTGPVSGADTMREIVDG